MEKNKPSLEYLAEMHEHLREDYYYKSVSAGCSPIAFRMAKKLLEEGRSPEILIFSKQIQNRCLREYKLLKPLPYEGRQFWFCHIVCLCDGKIYDPIFEEPVPLKIYSMKLFGEEVPSNSVMT